MRHGVCLSMLLLVAAGGCSTLSGDSKSFSTLFGKKWVVADAQNPAVEVACIWQPGEGRAANGVPARGFSGQIFFFTRNDAEPALVNGSIRVYLFADRGTPEEQAKPLKEYDFTPQEWSTHATLTSLGPGYSVFVPYPDAEAYQVRCQLRVRFIPEEGTPVWSEALTMILEGPPRPKNAPNSWATDEAQALVGQKNQIEITRRSGTPAELNAQDGPRKLRTDTFSLADLQKAVYEAPERQTKDDLIKTASATAPQPHKPTQHALRSEADRFDALDVRRPRAARPLKSHPLDAESDHPSGRREPWHPLARVNSATSENPRRFLLSRPEGAPELSEEAVATEIALPSNGMDDPSETTMDGEVTASNSAEPQGVYSDATPIYGAWKSLGSSAR